jgi:hypothetical protein
MRIWALDSQRPKSGPSKLPAAQLGPPQKAMVNAVVQQNGGSKPPPKLMPCRLGLSLCQELHLLEKCEQFQKMAPEQRGMKVNELRLCQIRLRHTAEKESYQKGKAEYQGCSESRCGMDHHPLLHWALMWPASSKSRWRRVLTVGAQHSVCSNESGWPRLRSA